MLRSVIVGASRITLLVGFTAMVAIVPTGTPSYAADTEVNTTLCSGTSSNASLVVDSPASDSLLDELPLNITGTIANITQIDVSIDGQYNSTVPVSVNQTAFVTSLQLTEGTHTITLVGNDVCQFQNATGTLVVTYHPKVSPNVGITKPVVPANPSSSTSASGEDINSGDNSLQNVPIIGGLVPVARSIVRALDFDVTARQGGILTAMARFAFFVLGIGLIFFGAVVVRMLRKKDLRDQAVERYTKDGILQDPSLSAHAHRNIRIVRGTGLVFLCLAFVI